MDKHIVAIGWDNWSSPANEKTTEYVEYGNTGPGANFQSRVNWSNQLSENEAKKYSRNRILAPFVLPPYSLNE